MGVTIALGRSSATVIDGLALVSARQDTKASIALSASHHTTEWAITVTQKCSVLTTAVILGSVITITEHARVLLTRLESTALKSFALFSLIFAPHAIHCSACLVFLVTT